MVEEPTEEEAIDILFGLRDRYENHHRCRITDDAIVAAVQLSSRYIADRFLPDKAIDLIDEAGSAARIGAYMKQKEMALEAGEDISAASMEQMHHWRTLKQVTEKKLEAIGEAAYDEASLLRDRELEVKASLEKLGVGPVSYTHLTLPTICSV